MGHANLCGVLYVAYQTVYGLRGDYMLSILFKSYLLLALPKPGTRYEIVAIIGLGDVRVDKPDNGRGYLLWPLNKMNSITDIVCRVTVPQCSTCVEADLRIGSATI